MRSTACGAARLWSSGLRIEAECHAAIRLSCDDGENSNAAWNAGIGDVVRPPGPCGILRRQNALGSFAGFPAALERARAPYRRSQAPGTVAPSPPFLLSLGNSAQVQRRPALGVGA